jgi:hypothetical protein
VKDKLCMQLFVKSLWKTLKSIFNPPSAQDSHKICGIELH